METWNAESDMEGGKRTTCFPRWEFTLSLALQPFILELKIISLTYIVKGIITGRV